MKRLSSISLICLISMMIFSSNVFCADLIIDSIAAGSSWQGNTTGANPDSVFYIQVDDRPKVKISIHDSALVDNLAAAERHIIKIYLNGKRIESFWFHFKDYDSDQLRLRYNPFYGTWLLNKAGKKAETRAEPVMNDASGMKTIHVFVALCDNEKQGIVPVPEALGNGSDPGNNLYWGALYGVKTYFKRSSDWKWISTEENPDKAILERCIFRHKTKPVYIVADSYRGSQIKKAIEDLFCAAAGSRKEALQIEGKNLNICGGADVLAYIGHNGLMDFDVALPDKHDNQARNVIVLACKSKPYFKESLAVLNAKSLLLTTGFMAPEAYTLHAAIDAWIAGGNNDQIRKSAAVAYDKYQKCGLKAALNLFYSEQE